ncbi:MAG: hypothetical protein ABIO39_07760 [Caulobacteraceae bacterium]
MRFSASEAAFEGFRLTRQHPLAVLTWAGVMFAANLLSYLAFSSVIGSKWDELQAAAMTNPPDMAKLQPLLPSAALAVSVYLVIQLCAVVVVQASVLRAFLRPADRPRLSLGPDEVRVAGLLLSFAGVSLASGVCLDIIFGLLALVGGGALASASSTAAILVSMALYVRFALAGPMTVDQGRFRFWASWRATKGVGAKLLGAEFLAIILALVVSILAFIILVFTSGAIIMASGGALADVATILRPDMASPASVLKPGPLAYTALFSVLWTLVLVIWLGPPVQLYRAIGGKGLELEGSGI